MTKNIGHITNENTFMMCPTFLFMILWGHSRMPRGRFVNRPYEALQIKDYLLASSIATATATVIPTMGLLPAPIRPISSTWAGTEEEPAN